MSLSYVHRYHAGHFSDIHKHLVLIAVLQALRKKETPFCVLDAFSGEGLYDLHSDESQKLKEYLKGIGYILSDHSPSELVQSLIQIIQTLPPHHYPGSPFIIQQFLRQQDAAHLIEKHPTALSVLKQYFGKSNQLHVHGRDAYEAMNGLIPFKEKRGLVFIDPSYEVKIEYQLIAEAVNRLLQKFANGIFLIWYPLLHNMDYHLQLIDILKHGPATKVWRFEWTPFKANAPENSAVKGKCPQQMIFRVGAKPPSNRSVHQVHEDCEVGAGNTPENSAVKGIYGSGVVIINPPWGVDEQVINTFEHLKNSVYPDSHMESW
ncbi:MAG: 23S rRNA (adenine(2030)-N(6))-methyltransferase RlmJ [Gammaproteobacteria bacterium]